MKIGLIDVDGHNFPNLALMKISAYHKAKGDSVEFVQFWGHYDRVYKSKVFTFTRDVEYSFFAPEIYSGGTGYNSDAVLPNEIEIMTPDYSLYPQYDYALGYLTRGCPRNCPFCIVGEKEGYKSVTVSSVDKIWKGQKEIKLLDPNLTASVDCMHLLRSLRKTNALIDFTQGLDIRFLNNEMIELLKTMRIKRFHFAYDRLVDSKTIEQNLINFRDKTGYHKPSHNNVTVYVLVNYETSLAEDLYRLQFIRKLGFQPYVMIYNKHDLIKGKSIYFKLQRWVNNPPFFWKYSDFEAYLKAYQLRRCV